MLADVCPLRLKVESLEQLQMLADVYLLRLKVKILKVLLKMQKKLKKKVLTRHIVPIF